MKLVTSAVLGMCYIMLSSTLTANMCQGCMSIAPDPVQIAKESAIIVWNPKTHVEHFMRTASFETSSKDFGFIVPTPSVPKITTANIKAMSFLEDLFVPRTHSHGRTAGIDQSSVVVL